MGTVQAEAASGCAGKPLPGVAVSWKILEPLEPGRTQIAELQITARVAAQILQIDIPGSQETVLGDPPRYTGRPDIGQSLRFPVSVRVPTEPAPPLVARVQVESAAGRYWVGASLPFQGSEREERGRRVDSSGELHWDFEAESSSSPGVPRIPPASSAQPQVTLFGKFFYRDRLLDPDGFVHESDVDNPILPIRFAEVELLKSGIVEATGFTNGQGAFAFVLSSTPGTFQVRVRSRTTVAGNNLVNIYASASNPRLFNGVSPSITNPGQNTDLGDLILEPTGGGEAFNIMDACFNGMLMIQVFEGSLPVFPSTVYWNPVSGEATRYSRGEKAVYLNADEGYDDPVILHEFGHFVSHLYSKDSNPGGIHFIDDSDQDPRLSWGEGFASYFQSAVRAWVGETYPSWYIDTHGAAGQGQLFFSYDCELPTLAVRGPASEVAVHATLWEIEDGPATPGDLAPGMDDDALLLDRSETWEVLTGPIISAENITLEDFWEGWFAVGNGFTAEMRDVFSTLGNEYFGDLFEEDNAPGTASIIHVGNPRSHHTFYPKGDEDHFLLHLSQGQSVSVETLNILGFGDTALEIRGPGGGLVGANNNRANGDLSSLVSFTASTSGAHQVRVSRAASSLQSILLDYGSYDIRVLSGAPNQPVMVPLGSSSGVNNGGFGVGVALTDFDGDDRPDIFVVNNAGAGASFGKDALYRNLGNLTFTNFTASSGLGNPEGGIGAAWGDADNDGDPDLFVTDHGFFRNEGGGTFIDVTEASGIEDIGREFDAQWVDTDLDSDLDLFVVRRDGPSALWRNNGDGTFQNITDQAGFGFAAEGTEAFSCSWSDYNGDMLPDLFLAFRQGPGHALYRNLGDNLFFNVTGAAGLSSSTSASCGVWGDVNNDGHLDLFVAARGRNRMYINQGNETFVDEAEAYALDDPQTAANAALADYDLDGDLDLFLVNTSGADGIFENLGTTMIRTNQAVDTGSGFGCAWGDMDGDGDPDLYLSRGCAAGCESNRLYANFSNNNGTRTWLKVKLQGTLSNRDGVGAVVRVFSGETLQTRWVGAGMGWASKSRLPELFGIPGGGPVDSVTVRWPSGVISRVLGPGTNQVLSVVEFDQTPVLPDDPTILPFQLSPASPNPFRSATTLFFVLPEPAPVRVEIFDLNGRLVRRLIDGEKDKGVHVAGWDGRDKRGNSTAPGVYFYRFVSGNRKQVRKIVRLAD